MNAADPNRSKAYRPAERAGMPVAVESTLDVCVVVDERAGEPVLGTTSQPDTLRASVYCAIQNLWLAARVEGLGVGG